MPVITYQPEKSWEATTLDYLSPIWYPLGEAKATEEEAEAVVAAARAAVEEAGAKRGSWEAIVFKVRKIVTRTPEEEAAWFDEDAAANRRYWADRARAADAAKAAQEAFQKTIRRGQPIRVVKGRKVPIGTEGHIFWSGENQWGWRVGFETPDGVTHWTAASNIEAIEAVGAAAPEGVAA